MSTSGTSYGAEVMARREAMRLARNAAFYRQHSHDGASANKWRELVKQRVREARAANRRVVARVRDMRRETEREYSQERSMRAYGA